MLTSEMANKMAGLLFVSPFLIGFFVFTLFPIIQTIRYSFHTVKFSGIATIYVPVNLKNYKDVLFNTPDFRLQLTSYLRLILLLTPIIIVFSVLLALLLNVKLNGRRIFRAVYFLPVILISGPMLSNLFKMEAFSISGLNEFFVFKFLNEILPAPFGGWWGFIISNIVLCLWFSAAVSWCYFFIILIVVIMTYVIFGRKAKEKTHVIGKHRN